MGAELNQKLFSAADSLRGKMSADQYKDYLLGLIFYKYLSGYRTKRVGFIGDRVSRLLALSLF